MHMRRVLPLAIHTGARVLRETAGFTQASIAPNGESGHTAGTVVGRQHVLPRMGPWRQNRCCCLGKIRCSVVSASPSLGRHGRRLRRLLSWDGSLPCRGTAHWGEMQNNPVPDKASAHALVAVAIPDRWVRELSRVRSAPSSSLSGARMRSTSAPASIRSPSARIGSVPKAPRAP